MSSLLFFFALPDSLVSKWTTISANSFRPPCASFAMVIVIFQFMMEWGLSEFLIVMFSKKVFQGIYDTKSVSPPHCLCCFGMSDLWRVLINNYKKNLTQQLPVNVNTWVSCCSALKHHIFYLLDSFIQVICKCAKIHINTKYQYQYWIMILSRKNTDHHKIRIRSPGQMTMWVWVSTPPPGFKLNLNNVHSQWKFVCLQL